ncbi:MAG: adenylosuccinate synthetase [Deltaproteobacteria bacterium]|nr:adenylosuccinate synthetase [Deltaproteobacteria bacterium]
MATAWVVTDIGYGDAGKGALVDQLAARHSCTLVVRVHGGAQAGHNVVAPDGRQHTFSQFGAASFQAGRATLHAAGMIVAPLALRGEADHLHSLGVDDPIARLRIDGRCRITTPLHQAANRLREAARGAGRHGSCGIGVGETVRDGLLCGAEALCASDLRDPTAVRRKLASLRDRLVCDVQAETGPIAATFNRDAWVLLQAPLDELSDHLCGAVARVAILAPDEVRAAVAAAGDVIVEGAQGVLLDEWVGFHPHTTWSTCTTASANGFFADVGWTGAVRRFGVLRCYMMRHGAGPLPGEDSSLDPRLPERHNALHPWQGRVRKAPLDLVALRYAIDACGDLDALCVTHLDQAPRLPPQPWTVAWRASAADVDWVAERRGDDIVRLGRPAPPDLDRQHRLTRLAFSAAAVAGGPQPPAADRDAHGAFAREIGRALGLPVAWCAAGPTRQDWWVPST